ncbi:hypothetical protein KEF85_10770 [Methylomonas paludis]|uniref:Uncharacterized protein n=1 Tax=Methylomonas paludis TaxID=1173101 RepID=A0A975R928_9GAMM|nr:hypothetical protein [Methylomonas paludis]QWF69843.1 hypothetical protein KEF85_10770 [Methylomonas paludis]
MRISKILACLLSLVFSGALWAQAAPSHGGHGGGSGGDDACIKAKITRFKPEHLSTVAPGAEFQFTVSGSNGPGHIHVTIRQQAIPLTVEDKDSFYLVKGKLPDTIKNETVRISVKAKTKTTKCDADEGILLKVTE